MKEFIGAIGMGTLIAFTLAWIIFWPFAVIWALNTLFGLGIGYTFWTWLAVLVVNLTISGARVKSEK